ncbi:MAG: nitrogen fixation protein NifS, partial [Myxococcota bacterium]
VAAAAGVIDYFEAVDTHHFGADAPVESRRERISDLFRTAEQARLAPLMSYLKKRGVRVLGPTDPDHRMPTVAVATNKTPEASAEQLAEHGIMAGASHFYAPRVLERMNVDPERGVLRMSFVHYTAPDDVDALIQALDRVL